MSDASNHRARGGKKEVVKAALTIALSVLAISGLRNVLDGVLLHRLPFLLFLAAVALSTVVGGYRAGLIATAASILAGVLLVEDDPMVRQVTSEMLQAAGHEVLTADGGATALRLSREHGGPIDAMVTDVVLPWMNGRQVADEVKKLHPSIAVLYISGYSENVILNKGVLKPGINVIRKPFTSVELQHALRQAVVGLMAAS